MFAEKVCEQVVGFSVMAEDEMFEVNGGYQADGSGLSPDGRNGGGGGGFWGMPPIPTPTGPKPTTPLVK